MHFKLSRTYKPLYVDGVTRTKENKQLIPNFSTFESCGLVN